MSEKNLLVMIIDINTIGWSVNESKNHSNFTLNEFIDVCVGFLNAYVAMSQKNAVALIASHDTKALVFLIILKNVNIFFNLVILIKRLSLSKSICFKR